MTCVILRTRMEAVDCPVLLSAAMLVYGTHRRASSIASGDPDCTSNGAMHQTEAESRGTPGLSDREGAG
ncbi:hypothetical protein BSP109_01760 [Brevibacterium sp. Mu109]|nr:hypothetical protein BSP109_01760 [Brevibacterium sp. Mu109]